MKRHLALIPLSRDHHDGLVQALRLRRAAAEGDTARLKAARKFVDFFRNEERVHLRDEEEELFPLFLRHVQSQPAFLRQARVQHMQLEGYAPNLEVDLVPVFWSWLMRIRTKGKGTRDAAGVCAGA